MDKKEYNRRYKKYKRAQIKAWNLNLDKAEDIRVVCNADEIPEQFLRDIAAIIKNDNHDWHIMIVYSPCGVMVAQRPPKP